MNYIQTVKYKGLYYGSIVFEFMTADDVDSRVHELEIDLDILKDKISDLNSDIRKLKEDFNIWGLFNKRMIPFFYEESFKKSLNYLEKTAYIETVDCFKNLQKDSDIPYPLTNKNYSGKNKYRIKKKSDVCTTVLRNSKEFFESAKTASMDTKPILYYYSITFLFKFLMESFIDSFGSPKMHHGLYPNHKSTKENIAFDYKKEGGFFTRLVHTLSILNYPSSFSSFVPDLDDKKNIILKEQNTDISISNTRSILLSKLLTHKFKIDFNNLKSNLNRNPAGYGKRYEKTSSVIRDFILIFLSGSMARYNPILWREVYSGNDSELIFHFEKSFNNVNDMIRLVEDIFEQAQEGKLYLVYDYDTKYS